MVFLVKKTIGLNQALGFFGLNQTTLINSIVIGTVFNCYNVKKLKIRLHFLFFL